MTEVGLLTGLLAHLPDWGVLLIVVLGLFVWKDLKALTTAVKELRDEVHRMDTDAAEFRKEVRTEVHGLDRRLSVVESRQLERLNGSLKPPPDHA